MSADRPFTKENLDECLKELAKEFRKRNGKKMPAEIILIGGASILINYGFREMTYDMDAIVKDSGTMKDAINSVGDRLGLPVGWLNTDFIHTSSYTPRLETFSKYYKTFANILQIRTISAEYLVAMKLMAGRQYKNDLSDIVGIIYEHGIRKDELSFERIQKAVTDLYDSYDRLPEASRTFIESVYARDDLSEFYKQCKELEKENKDVLIQFQEDYPDTLNSNNLEEILKAAKAKKKDFLPITKEDMLKRGWQQPDFVYVIGDAYVDHSSFGPAIISRVLEAHGYKVAIISQPDWNDPESIDVFGEPRLGFLVSSGNMDSMVNHYTVNKKRRHEDAYTPGGKAGKRPDRAVLVYCNLIKKKYKDVPVIIGGIEASLRRLGHYDYWSDKMKRSILMDSGADLLSYGMGEKTMVEIADALNQGFSVSEITYVRGTVYKAREIGNISGPKIILPDYDEISSDKVAYAKSFNIQSQNTDAISGKILIEKYGEKRYIIQNPPAYPLTMEEMDEIYDLPYMNTYHPSYEKEGGVPAIKEIKFSLTSNRGCFGGCSFCALNFHQGRVVQVRSHESLLKEAKAMTEDPEFKGYIHDVGGPTADFRRTACDKQMTKGVCTNKQCMYPEICKNMVVDHSDYLALLRKLRALPKVKKVFIRSGIRFDYVMAEKDSTFLREVCKYHVSGQLRVAPEHVSDRVLKLMGKPKKKVYEDFCKKFDSINKELDMKQYVVPYLISSHPGSTLEDAIALAESVRDMGYMPEQVQDFYPTPSTISTCMYYTGLDPRTMEPVYVPETYHEKAMQRALIQYRDPANYKLVKEALLTAGREDLIGFDRTHCLIPPRQLSRKPKAGETKRSSESKGNSGAAKAGGKSSISKNSAKQSDRQSSKPTNNKTTKTKKTTNNKSWNKQKNR